MEHAPTVTVLMCVYNGERYLREAIESILRQTFTDFEFLIIDDGSTDASRSIVLSYDDPRIRLVVNETNIGLTKSLNKGLDLARGEYVARMDADDVSMPERLGKQVDFMNNHPWVGVCGTWIDMFGITGKSQLLYPVGSDALKSHLFFNLPQICHPSVTMRKDILDRHKLRYDENRTTAQDFDLWVRFSKVSELANIGEKLFCYRMHDRQISANRNREQRNVVESVVISQLVDFFPQASDEEKDLHVRITQVSFVPDRDLLKKAFEWLAFLGEMNERNKIFDCEEFRKASGYLWYRICRASSRLGFSVFVMWFFSSFVRSYRPSIGDIMRFMVYAFLKK